MTAEDKATLGETPARPFWRGRLLWSCVLAWTVFVGFSLWWLFNGNGGLSVWVFRERDLDQPGFSDKIQAMFRGEFGLQRIYPWILFSPFLALMAWYFPLERERLRRNLPLNAAACLAFAWACYAIDLRTTFSRPRFMVANPDHLSAPGRPAAGDFKRHLHPSPPAKFSLRSTVLDLLAYAAVTGLVHSANFHRRLRERERRALFLESNLTKARLNALKAQLQPHFLFNSLNAITALVRRDPRLAESTLVSLSELLRLALNQSEREQGTLREELEFVQRYVEIQQTRFGDKLRVEQDIDPQALECIVPTLVLQPLVENAIRHGIEPSEKNGVVRLSASRKDATLVLAVEDDGVGLVAHESGTRIGLANLRERLHALYGERQKLELTARPSGGVIVRVEIPWRPHGST